MNTSFACRVCGSFVSEIPDDPIVNLHPCGHIFHQLCVRRALLEKPACPVCQKPAKNKNITVLQGVASTKKVKIGVVGDSGVGKTSLSQQYTTGHFYPHIQGTIGIDYWKKTVTIGEETIRLNICDTAGQDRYKSMTPQSLRGCDGVILVFDTTHQESLLNITDWLTFVNEICPDASKLLVGCKEDIKSCTSHTDSSNCRSPTLAEIEETAKNLKLNWYLASAKTAYNVEVIFRTLIGNILESCDLECEVPTIRLNKTLEDDSLPKRSCC